MQEPDYLRIVYTQEEIIKRVKELGQRITSDYSGKELVMIGVLKGSSYFFVDLTRAVCLPLITDYISIGVYPYATGKTGVVRITKDLDTDITGKHVLIVEDIIRTGLTLAYLVQNLETRLPKSVKVCALLVNPDERLIDLPIEYGGFSVSNAWLMGYGMDAGEKWRNLPYIVEIEKK